MNSTSRSVSYIFLFCALPLLMVAAGVRALRIPGVYVVPHPKALSTSWYTRPGFIAGIPAVPWIMPFLLGVVLLRRAGDRAAVSTQLERSATS